MSDRHPSLSIVLLTVTIILLLMGGGVLGLLGARAALTRFRNLANRLLGAGEPASSSHPGQACWTSDTQNGLILQATFGSENANTTISGVLVDTGAFISAAPKDLASRLHINLYSGIRVPLGSIFGDTMTGYVHNVNLSIQGLHTVQVPIAILPRNDVPYVLGREGFLDQFGLEVSSASGVFCLSQS